MRSNFAGVIQVLRLRILAVQDLVVLVHQVGSVSQIVISAG